MADTNNSSVTQDSANETPRRFSRRKFLVKAGLGTLGVVAIGTFVFRNPMRRAVLAMAEKMVVPYYGKGTEPNLWFEITSKNQVRFHSPKVEMGQGTFTGLAQVIADELDVSIAQIEVVAASTNSGVVDGMSTGGSLSIASLWQPLREMAATMREMIKSEAAKQLKVDIADLKTEEGFVKGGSSSLSYAKVAESVNEWTIPSTPKLRPLSDYRFVGKPIPRIDLAPKVFGEPIFGMDASMEDLLYATVIRPDVVGANTKSVDTSNAEKMPGVVKIVQKEDWVAVVAESFPQALAAREKIEVQWNVPKKWTEEDVRQLIRVGNGNMMATQIQGAALDPGESDVVSMEFTSPLGAHAQIEPNAAVANVKDGQATVILSTQVVGITQKQVAQALGYSLDQVNIIPTYLGGGFGRRLNTSHAIQAAQLSQEVGRPVKYVFTRKEEFQHDLFRPPTHHVMRGKLNGNGLLESLEHHYASGDVSINSLLIPPIATTIVGTDIGALRGGNIQYDNIPNHRAVQWHTTLPFATSWWRSLGLLANTFAIESFVDEMALKAKKNPVDFRLAHLGNEETSQRLATVIKLAADKAGYKDASYGDRAMGIAASIDANVPCALVAEVSVEDRSINVHKLVVAFDCGLAVNPDQVRAQCEGCVIMGMSAAMFEQMTLIDGQLSPTNYGPYQMALMRHTPKEIDIHLVQGVDHPLPVGEPPMGPIGAAVGNAVRRLTGQRLTDLPLQLAQ